MERLTNLISIRKLEPNETDTFISSRVAGYTAYWDRFSAF